MDELLVEIKSNPSTTVVLTEFHAKIDTLKPKLELLKSNVHKTGKYYAAEFLKLTTEEPNLQEDTKLRKEFGIILSELQKDFEALKIMVGKYPEDTIDKLVSADILKQYTQKFLDIVTDLEKLQTKYKNRSSDKLKSQILIENPHASQQDINKALENGLTQVFSKRMMDPNHKYAVNALEYVENKHRDILLIEQGIDEIHQLNVVMAILVDKQTEVVENVETNVAAAIQDSKQATQTMRDTNKLQKSIRKKNCCIIVLLIAIAACIVSGLSVTLAHFV